MAAKKVDPLKAKEAKQKKIAIGGAVLLLGLLAVQGPKTMKMLQGPQAPAPATAAAAAPTPAGAPAAPAPGATAAGEVPATAGAELVSVPDSDQPPVIEDGQLESFERFASKDPFTQQAEALPAKPAAPAAAEGDAAKPAAKQAEPGAAEPAAAAAPAGEQPADGGFTTGAPAAPAEEPVQNAATTSIAVNGVAEDVEVEKEFPATEPTFVLVKLGEDGKSVEIGIAGGSYANGEETLKLTFGKKVTLQNTADGSRYELELLSVAGFPLPKKG